MGSQLSAEVKPYEYWLRVTLALEVHVQTALLDVVHNRNNDPSYQGLPDSPVHLYQYLYQNHYGSFQRLLKKNILKPDQFNLLLPANGQTDSSKWDITLIVLIIRNCTNIQPPINGWTTAAASDVSKGAAVIKSRDIRNWLKHSKIDEVITERQFNAIWEEIKTTLECLDYNNMSRFQALETDEFLNDNIEEVKTITAKLVMKEIDQAKKDLLKIFMTEIQKMG